MAESVDQIREFIFLTEEFLKLYGVQSTYVTEDVQEKLPETPKEDSTLTAITDLIFKLRSYQESEQGDYGLGVEAGMNKAADMLENLVERIRSQNVG